MKIDDIIKSVKEKLSGFGKKKKKSGKITKKEVWEAEIGPENIQQLPEVYQKAFYKVKGERDNMQDTIRKQREMIQELRNKKYEEQKEEAFKQEQRMKENERKNRRTLFFKYKNGEKPLFIVSALDNYEFFGDENGREFKEWRGIMFERTDNGPAFRFILGNKELDEYRALPKSPISLQYYPHMFEQDKMITDMRTGKVAVNITKDGNYAPPQMRVSEEESEEGKKKMQMASQLNEEMKKLQQMNQKVEEMKEELEQTSSEEREKDLASKISKYEDTVDKKKQELQKQYQEVPQEYLEAAKSFKLDMNSVLKEAKPEVRHLFFDLYNKYSQAKHKQKKATIRARKVLLDKHETEIAAQTSMESEEKLISRMDERGKQLNKLADRLTDQSSQLRSARISASSAENEVEKLWEAMEEQAGRISKRGKSDREEVKEEFKDDLDFISDKKQEDSIGDIQSEE